MKSRGVKRTCLVGVAAEVFAWVVAVAVRSVVSRPGLGGGRPGSVEEMVAAPVVCLENSLASSWNIQGEGDYLLSMSSSP